MCRTYFELFAPAFPVGGFPPKNGLSPTDLNKKLIRNLKCFSMVIKTSQLITKITIYYMFSASYY